MQIIKIEAKKQTEYIGNSVTVPPTYSTVFEDAHLTKNFWCAHIFIFFFVKVQSIKIMESIYKINVPLAAASYLAKKKPLDQIFDGVMAIYPDLDCMQLYSILRKIKAENNNTLRDLSMIQILDQVAELKGNYLFHIQKGEQQLY